MATASRHTGVISKPLYPGQIILQYRNLGLFTFSAFILSTSAKKVRSLATALHLITNNILYSLFTQCLVAVQLDVVHIRAKRVESLFPHGLLGMFKGGQ